uniref:C2H2-type domain-containing protein n=1 Tax=Eptatretus burgeri TaxID=7764 RepID=A0A8C4R873_EPTBU
MAEWSNRGWTMSVRSKQIAVMEFLRAEKVPAVDIHRRVRLVYGDTMDAKTRGDLGYIPAWLEIQGLMEESLRAAVTGLGIEILGALCARAEPAAARIRLCSLVPQKFTSKMYAELCRFMETCHVGQMAEWPAVPRCLKDADETRGHAGIQPKNLEDECSVIPEEEAKHLENGFDEKLSKKLPCTPLSRTMTTKTALKRHMNGQRPAATVKTYKCRDCYYSTCYKSIFVKHIQIHPRRKRYTCGVCAKKFVWPSCYHRHMRIHSGAKLFTCPLCKKRFYRSSLFWEHVQSHFLREPQYRCETCSKMFLSRASMLYHKRTHSVCRPHACHICGRGFSLMANLKRHMLIHTGERPYKCTICSKAFQQSAHCKATHANSQTSIHAVVKLVP